MKDDTISRQAAIDALYNVDEYNQRSVTAIKNLPSIQTDTTTHDSIPVKTGKKDDYGTSGDCISRQQAIDALRKMQTYKLFAGDDMLLIDQAEAQTELMMLPSVQPEPEAISKWKKEFREYVDSLDIARDDWKGIIEYIDELPSAQPEIIRCKDCKHSRFFDPCFYCYEMGGEIIVPENGFCFKAERNEDT